MSELDLSYISASLRVLAVPIDDIHLDPANARVGHDLDRIAGSLKQYGQRKPLIVNRLQGNKIEAGNGTWQAAKNKLGWSYIAVVFVDDDPATAAAFGIADNRVAEFSKWDPDALEDILETVGDLFTGFEIADIGDVIKPAAGIAAGEDPGPELDIADELQKKWGTAPSQLWLLDEHRLLCGDSTIEADVVRILMGLLAAMSFTDPPWNVAIGIDGLSSHRQRKAMENDNLSPEEFATFLRKVAATLAAHVTGDIYCVMGASEWPTIDAGLRQAGFHWSGTIIWEKDQFVMGRSNYHRRYEPIWYGWLEKGKSSFMGGRDQDDVWEYPRPKKSIEHPTMKPLGLVERAISNSSQVGDMVFETFGGSGTTLIACHRLKRVARVIEKDPRYVAVILERWFKMTGKQPVLA